MSGTATENYWRVGLSTVRRRRATEREDVWSWDFVTHQMVSGRSFRILTLIDEHTRECLATHASWPIRAADVITVIEAAIMRHGAPALIRSENGPEFIAYAVQDWLKELEIEILHIKPGSPWEQAQRLSIASEEGCALFDDIPPFAGIKAKPSCRS